MFGRKSNQTSSNRPSSSNSKRTLSQYGLMDVAEFDGTDGNFDDDEDDDDLEAELLALTSDEGQKKPATKKSKQLVNPTALNKMIQDSLRDIPSDEDVSSGEDDPSILAELEQLGRNSTETLEETPNYTERTMNPIRNVLTERLKMYEIAEENAKKSNESSKIRRMTRGIGILKDLIKKADGGHPIVEDDIPPPVSVAAPKHDIPVAISVSSPEPVPTDEGQVNIPSIPPPIPPRAVKSSFESNDSPLKQESEIQLSVDEVTKPDVGSSDVADMLKKRQEQYKVAALVAKRNGDLSTALNYVRVVKQFEIVINQVNEGASVDLSTIPPPLDDPSPGQDVSLSSKSPPELRKQESIKLTSSSADEHMSGGTDGDASSMPAPELYDVPKTVLEALEQRLKKFQENEEAAKKENNDSKVRRMGRIVKQYKDAIKLHKAGKPIPVDELPTPPGFARIPVDEGSSVPAVTEPSPRPTTTPQQVAEKKPAPPRVAPTPPKSDVPSPSTLQLTRNEKQLQTVLERQKVYKLAALKAKKEGDLDAAREYLKVAKGMDPMIEASRSGLPIDLNSLPLPPDDKKSLDSEYEIVRLNDCIEGTAMDVYNKLTTDLQHQFEMCIKTRDHYKAVGDVANANRVEQLAVQTKKDLKFVQLAELSNLKVPKFHYETKPFTLVQCNTDLTDNEIEVIMVQGINYNVPNPQEVDTYIKLYFPYPAETPQQYKTSVVYNTNNPKYDASVKFSIQRNARACQRIIKRQTLKCEVWSKGGFFRSDNLIGTVNAKLQPLETQCTIHDAFDLMDGRKTVGGKLELKIKARDPILKKEVVHTEEKWLIIDT